MDASMSPQTQPASRAKFFVGGLLIVVAIIYLIVSSTQASAQYFLTIEEVVVSGEDYKDRELRISGAVIGDSIVYDTNTLDIAFTVAHVPGDNADLEAEGGLAAALHNAVTDPARARVDVLYNGPMPDLLQDEAQAIMTGRLGEDGIFYADELLLKCPTKYEEAIPEQVTK
ncbi:MAG: cytochrome c maturation protein CcmE [Chloroflexi bacterium]|nr:cytochrome c maturation protein CcmE [Chloroflexota bacterium]